MGEPGKPETTELGEYLVNSGNLFDYLLNVGQPYNEPSAGNFSESLDISWLRPLMAEYRLQLRQGKLYNQEELQELNRIAAETYKRFGLQEEANTTETRKDRVGQLEASCQIYYDPKGQVTKLCDISYGSGYSVTSSIGRAFLEGGLPLIDLHNHPESQLFSPPDYTEMLLAFPDGRRLVRGMLVLCPEGLLLALATSDTPRFTKWSDGFAATKQLLSEQGKSHSDAMAAHEALKMAIISQHAELCAKELQAIGNVGTTTEGGTLAQEKIKESTQAAIDTLDATIKNQMNLSAKLTNHHGIITAREMGVVLYWSTDGETFKKFSA